MPGLNNQLAVDDLTDEVLGERMKLCPQALGVVDRFGLSPELMGERYRFSEKAVADIAGV